MKRTLIVLAALALLPALALAATIKVPGDYPTIQAAIDAAVNGDTVLVSPGIYPENIDFIGKAITLISSGGADVTVINGNQGGRVVTFSQNEWFDSILDGFTITNGKAQDGAGIVCYGTASPTIRNNSIHDNVAAYMGGGIHTQDAAAPLIQNNAIFRNLSVAGGGISCMGATTPVIEGNAIYANLPEHQGGAINIGGSAVVMITHNEMYDNFAGWGGGAVQVGDIADVTITHNLIRGNSGADGGGISFGTDSKLLISNNLILENAANWNGGGIFAAATGTIIHNTFYNNTTYNVGQGGALFVTPAVSVTVTDCICWNNSSGSGTDPEISGAPTVTYCDVEGGFSGTGNIDADPLFFNAASGDFHLRQDPPQPGITNPCVDTGSDLASNLGMDTLWTRTDRVPDAGTVDMGYHYGPPLLPWWKRLQTDVLEISETTGGQAFFFLSAGEDNQFRTYLLFGSVTGSVPGIALPGGKTTLPLNWDLFTNIVLDLLNTGVFYDFWGKLDSEGHAVAVFTMGPVSGAAGMTMTYAYALSHPWDFASNAVGIAIVP